MIYITGGTGRLGKALVRLFPKARLVRRGEPLDFHDADAVIHLAGSLNFNNPREMRESNVEFTRRVVAATPPTARLVFASSISVYGKGLVRIPADETTPCHPDSAYAKSKYEAERLILQHPDAVALRIAAVYGPGPEFREYWQMLRRVEKGKIFILGNGQNRIPFVHVEDVARAFQAALKAPRGVYVISGEPVRQEQAYRMAAEKLGVKPPTLHLPVAFARLIVLAGVLSGEAVSLLYNDRVFDCSKARKMLGFRPRTFEEGLEEMVAYYRGTAPPITHK